MEIVLATRNKKKLAELSRILSGMDINLLTLDDFPACPEVKEDRDTFEGNAVKKALTIAECTGKTAVADDSGIEVYALNGAPGVRSARYAGEGASDGANMEKLLMEMESIPDDKRGARFVCCIALAFPDTPPRPPLIKGEQGGVFSETKVVTLFGFVEGRIGREPRGSTGFGYDPVFYPSGYDRTFAEMSPEEKDALSHRAEALGKLKKYFQGLP